MFGYWKRRAKMFERVLNLNTRLLCMQSSVLKEARDEIDALEKDNKELKLRNKCISKTSMELGKAIEDQNAHIDQLKSEIEEMQNESDSYIEVYIDIIERYKEIATMIINKLKE